MVKRSDTLKAAAILGSTLVFEGFFVGLLGYRQPRRFFVSLGFVPGSHTSPVAGWFCAALVTVGFILLSARLPSVRENLFRLSWLKLVAIGAAFAAGILEGSFSDSS